MQIGTKAQGRSQKRRAEKIPRCLLCGLALKSVPRIEAGFCGHDCAGIFTALEGGASCILVTEGDARALEKELSKYIGSSYANPDDVPPSRWRRLKQGRVRKILVSEAAQIDAEYFGAFSMAVGWWSHFLEHTKNGWKEGKK